MQITNNNVDNIERFSGNDWNLPSEALSIDCIFIKVMKYLELSNFFSLCLTRKSIAEVGLDVSFKANLITRFARSIALTLDNNQPYKQQFEAHCSEILATSKRLSEDREMNLGSDSALLDSKKLSAIARLQEWRVASDQLTERKKLASAIGKELPQCTNLANIDAYIAEANNNWCETHKLDLANLQRIELRHNQLASLPSEVGYLVNLERLELNDNQLASLPSEMGNLTNLQFFFFSGNQLASLPSEMGNLAHLQGLHLWYNQLASLPSEMGSLVNLQQLELNHNQLAFLPSEMGNLVNLQRLELSHNQLASLPSEMGNLVNLQRLELSHNQLASLPSEMGNLTKLQKLYLNHNQLAFLPSEMGSLVNLQQLHLDDYLLASLPSEMGSLANLQELYLYNNQFAFLLSEIVKLR